MKELKIVVVDDSPLIREGLQGAFSRVEGCVIIGTAADGDEAISIIGTLRPDVVVLDISLPHRNGIQVLREIRKEDPETVIIMYTADPSVILREVCLEAGANFYLDKSQVLELLSICGELLRERRSQS